MARVGTAYVDIKPDWAGFNRELGRGMPHLNRGVANIGGNITRQFAGLGKQASLAFAGAATTTAKVAAAGIGAALVASVKVAGDFEQQLSSLGSVADASAADMERLRKAAIKAGAATKFSALEAAEAQTELAKGGLRTAEILGGGLNSALALAAAGELGLADAASTTVNAMKLFGLNGKSSMKVADAFATAANSTTADVKDFALALNQTGSAAKTVGLDFPETIAALETLAEVGIKGSDAGTSLKTALIQLASPSSVKAVEMTEQLGLKLFDSNGEMKSLVDVSAELRKALGGLTAEQRINAATTLVGQDGFRALLALYEAGPTKVEKLQRELNKQGSAAEVAKKKQDNLKGSLEALGGSIETLGIQVGSAMIPAVRKGADELNDFTDEISKIVERDDLDVGEKLSESFRLARVTITPWLNKLKREIVSADLPEEIGKLLDRATNWLEGGLGRSRFAEAIGRQIERADLAGKFGELVDAAMPHIVGAISTAAKTAAGAFVKAFIAADSWGKLALGAWLMSKMGGVAAFTALGRSAGAAMGAGAASAGAVGGTAGAGAGAAGSGKLSTVKNVVGRAGNSLPIVGTTALAILGYNESRDAKKAEENAKSLAKVMEELEASLPNSQRFQEAGDAIKRLTDGTTFGGTAEQWNAMEDAMDRLGLSLESTPEQVQAAKDAFDGLKERFEVTQALLGKGISLPVDTPIESAKKVETAISRMANGTSGSIKSLRTNVRMNTKLIKEHLDKDSTEGKQALSANFRAAAQNVKRSMKAGEISTKEGTAEIRRLMVKSLGQFGFSEKQALNIMETGDDQGNRGREGGASSAMGRQTGGIVPGVGDGDKVRRDLPAGSFVLNREATSAFFQGGGLIPTVLEPRERVFLPHEVKQIGLRNLEAMNAAVPRFRQEGGIVELLHPFNDPKGHGGSNSHLHVAAATVAQIVALGRRLQQMGWLVSEHPQFGGVNARHAAKGYHYTGQAIDVNWPDPGQEASKIREVLAMLGTGGISLEAPEIARVLVGGPDSPLKSLVQRAVDTARGAAQTVVDRAAGTGIEGAEVSAGGQFDKIALQNLWMQAGGPSPMAGLMAAIALAESGGNPAARNKSGASGLWQILGLPFPGDPFDPLTNARMAVAKYESQGLGAWEAYTKGMHTRFLREGGLVELLQTGGAPGKGLARFPLGGLDLKGTLKKIRTGTSEKLRGKALNDLVSSVKGIDMGGAAGLLARLAGDVDVFGDYADRAGALTDTGAIQEALQDEMTRRGGKFPAADQQAIVDRMLARVNGGTQLEWLTKQLTSMFDWRNVLIDTGPTVQSMRDQTAKLLEEAQSRVADLVKRMDETQKEMDRLTKERDKISGREDTLEDRIKGEMGKPAKKRDQKKLGAWRAELAEKLKRHREINARLSELRGVQRGREREREALEGDDGIVAALSDKRDMLSSGYDEITDNITAVQGLGSPMSRLAVLPPLGVFGGKLFDTQKLISDLTNNPPRVEATVGQQDGAESQSAEILKGLLDEANLRTAVSERAFDVFKGVPPYGGSFSTGGIVPGPTGAARAIIAHGGEEIIPVNGDSGSGVQVVVNVANGMEWLNKYIDVRVENKTRRDARTGARGLPGLGGGVIR